MTNPARTLIPAFVNPEAGNADEARGALRAAGGFDIREVPPHTLADHVRTAAAEGATRVLVAGGDGSIGSAAGVLSGTKTELAILPCGTLNHLAKDLSLPLELEAAARVARDGVAIPVDAAVVNDRLFLNTSSVGAYVTFVRMRERLERYLGYHIASFVAALRLLIRLPTFRVTLTVEGQVREYVTPLVFVGVGERELKLPTLGARVPGGRPGLHLMIIRRRSGARTLALAFAAAARGVDAVAQTPALDAFIVDEFRIAPRTRSAAVDGEIVRTSPPLAYRYVTGNLRVVVDRAHPAANDESATVRSEQPRSFRA
jgi:diacylglycerol kinase family enzyme